MAIQIVIGLLGFFMHAQGDLVGPASSLWDRFVFGAPILAPLLFADLALLAILGLRRRLAASRPLAKLGHETAGQIGEIIRSRAWCDARGRGLLRARGRSWGIAARDGEEGRKIEGRTGQFGEGRLLAVVEYVVDRFHRGQPRLYARGVCRGQRRADCRY